MDEGQFILLLENVWCSESRWAEVSSVGEARATERRTFVRWSSYSYAYARTGSPTRWLNRGNSVHVTLDVELP